MVKNISIIIIGYLYNPEKVCEYLFSEIITFIIVFFKMNKTPLLGKNIDELRNLVTELGMPAFTAKQIADWLYQKRAGSIDEMSNISVKNRELLKETYTVGRELPSTVTESVDGTKKYLFRTETNNFIETVYIPEDDRHTLCVSSQVGCKMNCLFCMTGKQGFTTNLTAAEILNQIMYYLIRFFFSAAGLSSSNFFALSLKLSKSFNKILFSTSNSAGVIYLIGRFA